MSEKNKNLSSHTMGNGRRTFSYCTAALIAVFEAIFDGYATRIRNYSVLEKLASK